MQNQTAVVTGSSSGIGKSVCDLLLSRNYKVYGVSRNLSGFDNPNFVWIQADLTNPNDYKKISSSITENKVNVLINNAGVAFEKEALEFDQESFEKIFDINFKAPVLLTKELKNKLNGLVINISSVSDRLVGEKYALYCSSKAALNIYFDVVALEEKGFKVVSILPDYVDTPLLRKLQENNEFNWDEAIKPEQIAEFVGKILDDEESIESGRKIIVVNNSLVEDLKANENVWGYNVDTNELSKLKA